MTFPKNSSEDDEECGERVRPKKAGGGRRVRRLSGLCMAPCVGIPRNEAGERLPGTDRILYVTGCGDEGEDPWLLVPAWVNGWK